jgi:tetratricopeptide (TPR) repeat protein
VTFYESGAIDLAIEEFRRATKRVPRVATYWLNLGVALLDEDKNEEAESALKRALRLNPI